MSKIETYMMQAGGVFLLLGAAAFIFIPEYATFIYLIGAFLFGAIQIKNGYSGKNMIIRRLRRQQIIGAVILMLAGVLMWTQTYQWTYGHHNEWMLCLTIGAILELYTSFRISKEMEHEQ